MIKKKIIYTAGSFDLFHYGHLNILLKAKKLGNYLIVGVSSDKLIKKYKKMKPIINYKERSLIIRELLCVDKVIKQENFFKIKQLKKYNIDIIVLGSDWKNKKFLELEKIIRKLKITLIYIPYTKHLSSSKIIEKIIRNSYDIIKNQIRRKKK